MKTLEITMTSASMTFGRPTRVAIPRGSMWFAAVAGFAVHALQRLDRWQQSLSQQEPQTADDVLAWAARIERSEPGFAADLRAAALRSLGEQDR